MDVPWMQTQMYTDTEEFLGKDMRTHLAQSMQEVATEEKRHAVAMNSFHQEIPSITVVRNRSWSKQNHKHSYNTKRGVIVIFRSHTKKNYYLWVSETHFVPCALLQQINALISHSTNAIAIGRALQQPWRAISLPKDSLCLSRCMDYSIYGNHMANDVIWHLREPDWVCKLCMQSLQEYT